MNLNKIFKWVMVLLIVISVGILVWGFTAGWGEGNVDKLLYWGYAMVGIALFCVIVFGLIVAAMNDPKSLIKLLIGLVVVAAICYVVYLISPGADPVAYNGEPVSKGTLRLTDTVLNLTYLAGGLAVLAIVCGEIISAIRNR